jgi:hypothetical protein
LGDKIWHGQNTRHPTGVIPEKDAPKRSKGTYEVSFQCDWSFDPADISRAMDSNSSAAHGEVCAVGAL